MIFVIVLVAIALCVVIGVIIGKKIKKGLNKNVDEFLSKKNTTLEKELQTFINLQNNNVRVQDVRAQYSFKYSNNELIGIIIKFKLEGNKNYFVGIISDSGTYTEFKPFSIVNYIMDGYLLLQKIYYKPNITINEEYITYLPRLENINNFNILEDEKIILNFKAKKILRNNIAAIGINANVTITNKTIYINSYAGGLWTIDLNDVSCYTREENQIIISLANLCVLSIPAIITEYKFCFDNDDINKFEELLGGIIWK